MKRNSRIVISLITIILMMLNVGCFKENITPDDQNEVDSNGFEGTEVAKD
ncbi:MAG: hypothetical protein ACLFQS_08495 [Bacteroidales bacterium]